MEDHNSAPPDDRSRVRVRSRAAPDHSRPIRSHLLFGAFGTASSGGGAHSTDHLAQKQNISRPAVLHHYGPIQTSSPTYGEVKGHLRIAASSKAGRSQQAVDPIGNPTIKPQVSLDDPAFPIIDKDLSLFTDKCSPAFSPSSPAPPVFYSRWRPSLRSGRTVENPAESEPSPGGPDVQQRSKGQTTHLMERAEDRPHTSWYFYLCEAFHSNNKSHIPDLDPTFKPPLTPELSLHSLSSLGSLTDHLLGGQDVELQVLQQLWAVLFMEQKVLLLRWQRTQSFIRWQEDCCGLVNFMTQQVHDT